MKDYLTPDTFDVAAKTMFARRILNPSKGTWPLRVYAEHLFAWNKFLEGDKQSLTDFVNPFGNLLCDMRDGRFDWNASPIPTCNGRVCNGRHRLAAALVLDQHIRTVEAEGPCDCSADHLRQLGANSWVLDSMAIEYCRLKSNARIAVVFGPHDRRNFELSFRPVAQVFYAKEINLAGPGPLNLIDELYTGEDWLQLHGKTKASGCFPGGAGPATIYGLDVRHEGLDAAKWGFRRAMGRGNDSVHINDTHAQTMKIAQALFNDNGIHFLNHACGQPAETAPGNETPVDSGGMLQAYGLRLARDIDFVDEPMHLEHHHVPLEDLIENPENFFWSRGIKYASVRAVTRMKLNRGEPKDLRDVELLSWLK